MKEFHYFMYGLLTGAVLILSTVLMVQNFNQAEAQGTATSTPDVAMATGNTQQGNNLLYMTVRNPEQDAPNLLVYSGEANNLSLVAARNLQFDRKLDDGYFGIQRGRGGQHPTSPAVKKMRGIYQDLQENEKNK